ncbi:MAG: hypothetical protein LBU34_14395 [Planctomycetaceae bacterium]|jgi:hypothetical protein|nr:hypothetical protein [Planctomycetaceae bacterium]
MEDEKNISLVAKPKIPYLSFVALYSIGLLFWCVVPIHSFFVSYMTPVCHFGLTKVIQKNIHVIEYKNEFYHLSNGTRVPCSFFIWFFQMMLELPILGAILNGYVYGLKKILGFDFFKVIEQYNSDCEEWKKLVKAKELEWLINGVDGKR